MLSRKNSKREKDQPVDLDWHIRDLRTQLAEQVAFVESKCECECTMLRELNDFFKKRSEIEAIYARALDKLARVFANRQPNALADLPDNSIAAAPSQTQADKETESTDKSSRRANATNFTTYRFWSESVANARRTAADHAALGELFERSFAARCVDLAESVQRAAKRWRVAFNEAYEQTVSSVNELQLSLRSYHSAFTEYASAGSKLTEMQARGDRIATQLSLRLAKRKNYSVAPESSSFMQRAICGASTLPAQAELDEHYAYSQTAAESTDERAAQLEDGDVLERAGPAMQKKVKAFERELEKKQSKCKELRLRAIRARNDYVLGLEACNAQLVRLQQDSAAELLDALHAGYHCTLQRLSTLHANAERAVVRGAQRRIEALRRCTSQLDARADRRCVLRQPTFARSRQLHFQPAREDELPIACLLFVSGARSEDAEPDGLSSPAVDMDAVQRSILLYRRVEELHCDADEDWRIIENSEKALLQSLALPPPDDEDLELLSSVCPSSQVGARLNSSAGATAGNGSVKRAPSLTTLSSVWTAAQGESRRLRAERVELEQALFDRMRCYLVKTHSLSGAHAKFLLFQRAMREQYVACARIAAQLGTETSPNVAFSSEQLSTFSFTNEQLATFGGELLVALLLRCVVRQPRSRSQTKTSNSGANAIPNRPRVFGVPLVEYSAASGELVPLVIVSCVRVLSELGIRQQGLFRVSGAQTEISELRTLFNRGLDPLAHVGTHSAQGMNTNANLHTVACLLKAYFRELGEKGAPLFPGELFDELVACAEADKSTSVAKLASLATRLAHPVFVTSRYLFAFLAHVAQYATCNMMDSYNLAVCFAPTLMPVPRDRDPVRLQGHAIDVIKTCIEEHETIFPSHVSGPHYRSILDASVRNNVDGQLDKEKDKEKTISTVPIAKRLVATTSSDALVERVPASPVRMATSSSLNLNDASTQTILMDVHYDVPIIQGARNSSRSILTSTSRSSRTDFGPFGDTVSASASLPSVERTAAEAEAEVDTETEADVENEAEAEWYEARVDYSYEARSEQECTLHKADVVRVYRRVSEDWYEGMARAHSGLIPAAYVTVLRRKTAPLRSVTPLAESSRSKKSESQTEAFASVVAVPSSPRPQFPSETQTRPQSGEKQAMAKVCDDTDEQTSLSDSKASLTQRNRGVPNSASKPSLASTVDSNAKLDLASSSENCSKLSLTQSESSSRSASTASASKSHQSVTPVITGCESPFLRRLNEANGVNDVNASISQQVGAELPPSTQPQSQNDLSAALTSLPSTSVSFDEIQNDIDAALAEVMSGLESLERQQREIERDTVTIKCDGAGTRTNAATGTAAGSGTLAAPLGIQTSFGSGRSTLADVFATTDQPTLRRISPNAPLTNIPNPNPTNSSIANASGNNIQLSGTSLVRPNNASTTSTSMAVPTSPKLPPSVMPKPKLPATTVTQPVDFRRLVLSSKPLVPTSVVSDTQMGPVAGVAFGGISGTIGGPNVVAVARPHEHHAGAAFNLPVKSSRAAEIARRKTTALTLPIGVQPEAAE